MVSAKDVSEVTKIGFRVDCSSTIGAGHIRRCLSLAQVLVEKGAEVTFYSAEITNNWEEAIGQAKSISLKKLAKQKEPSREWAKLIDQKLDWLVVDSYLLGKNFETAMRQVASKVAVIDDLVRPHDCDLLIDQNLGRELSDYADIVPENCYILTGPSYSLLEKTYVDAREKGLWQRESLDRALCYFGGGDVENTILVAMEALDERELPYDLVLGSSSFTGVSEHASKSQYCTLHSFVENMAAMMNKASLFVGSGGMTNWERCCLGLPSLIVTVADNQIPATEELAAIGAILYLGAAESVKKKHFVDALATLARAPQLLNSFGRRAAEIVDGRGAERIAKKMMRPKIALQLAQKSDCESLWKWRNAEENRKFSHDDSVIPLTNHQKWFAKALESMNRELLIAYLDGEAVGVLRFDLAADEALVSIYLVPGHHGRGLGVGILRAGEDWIRNNRQSIRRIRAEIQKINKPSEKVFHRAGYEETFGVWYLALD